MAAPTLPTAPASSATTTQYPDDIRHVADGQPGSAATYQRPSIDLEKRTSALKTFVEAEAVKLDTQTANIALKAVKTEVTATTNTITSNLATHVADTAKHSESASLIEAKAGIVTTKFINAAVLKQYIELYSNLSYDAVVGTLGDPGVTHSNIASALTSLNPAGGKIFVATPQTISATLVIAQNNIEVEFKRTANLTAATNDVNTAFQVNENVNDFCLRNATLIGFATAGVAVATGANRTIIRDLKYHGDSNKAVIAAAGSVQTSVSGTTTVTS